MNKWTKRIGVAVLAAVMMFGVIGSAAAQGPDRDPRGTGARDRVGRALLEEIAETLGIDPQHILAQLREGKTLAEILAEADIEPDALMDAVKTTLSDEIAQAVTDGKLTQEQADKLLVRLDDTLDRAVNALLNTPLPGLDRPTPIRDRILENVDNSLMGVLAEAAGMEPRDLLRDALTPPTLADIAAEYDLDPDTLIATAETRITEEINQAVADGKITQGQADTLLEGLHERLVERFNNPIRPMLRSGIVDRMRPEGIVG